MADQVKSETANHRIDMNDPALSNEEAVAAQLAAGAPAAEAEDGAEAPAKKKG